jgi:actin-related protein
VNAVVLDLGTWQTKAGYAGDDTPKAVFPSVSSSSSKQQQQQAAAAAKQQQQQQQQQSSSSSSSKQQQQSSSSRSNIDTSCAPSSWKSAAATADGCCYLSNMAFVKC